MAIGMAVSGIYSPSKYVATVAVLLLLLACTTTATLEQTAATATNPTPTLVPTVAPTATVTPAPPRHEPEHIPEEFDARVAAIKEEMEPVEPVWTVYFHASDWHTPGRDTVMGEVFDLLKLENIATLEGYQEISPETVIAAEPDIIIADSVESIVRNPALSGLHMTQDPEHIPHHIFVLSEGLSFEADDHHFMDAVEQLAAFVYPDVFAKSEDTDDSHSQDQGHGHGDEDEDEDESEGSDSGHDEEEKHSHDKGKGHSH